MRRIKILASGHILEIPETDQITISFSTTKGIFKVTGPIDLVFAAAAKAFRE